MKPIILTAAEVRAVLAGSVELRRVVWPQPWRCTEDVGRDVFGRLLALCPHGAPGSKLWVRETWQQVHPCAVAEGRFSLAGRAGIPGPPRVAYRVVYRADGEVPPYWHADGPAWRALTPLSDLHRELYPDGIERGWDSPVAMPHWASRLTLEITGVRVERTTEWEWVIGVGRVG
jgi:hypothetical protein